VASKNDADNSMPLLTFEQPLNEKSRSYLRLEQLFQQQQQNRSLSVPGQHVAFFKALFDLQELLERCDLRGDLFKDLEKQRDKFRQWASVPGVDLPRLQELEQRVQGYMQRLPKSPRPHTRLKEDKFLGAFKQRFSIPGGCCGFDVPVLQYWLALPQAEQQQQVTFWLADMEPLMPSLLLLLHLWREQGCVSQVVAKGGFYQDVAEGAEMIRMRVDTEQHVYPTVSGHKHRFAIRFLPFGDAEVGNIPFALITC